MKEFAQNKNIQEPPAPELFQEKETRWEVKEKLIGSSADPYEQVAWFVYRHLTGRAWFEVFVMANIFLIGLATGVDLETDGGAGDAALAAFLEASSAATTAVFTVELLAKLVAEAWSPENFFLDEVKGASWGMTPGRSYAGAHPIRTERFKRQGLLRGASGSIPTRLGSAVASPSVVLLLVCRPPPPSSSTAGAGLLQLV